MVALLITTITIVLSLLPGRSIPAVRIVNIPHLDKIVHVLMYTVMGFFWVLAWRNKKLFAAKALILVFSIGIILEFLQFYFLEGRFFEIFDIIANISGSLIGLGLFYFLEKYFNS